MPWGAVAGAVVGAVANAALAPSPSSGGGSGAAATAADPFAAQRPQYQDKLNTIMNGTFSPSDPSYSWRFSQGLEGVNRTEASQGLTNSGNQLAAISDYGQNQASTEYANQYSRLAQLSGANVGSPAAAGQIIAGQNQQQQQGATAFGSTLGNAAGQAVNNWLTPTPTADASTSSLYQPSSSYQAPSNYWDTSASSSSFWSGV